MIPKTEKSWLTTSVNTIDVTNSHHSIPTYIMIAVISKDHLFSFKNSKILHNLGKTLVGQMEKQIKNRLQIL